MKTFKDTVVKAKVKSKGKMKEFAFQRDLMGMLVACKN